MYKLRDKIIFFKVIGFLLIIFLPSISMAASVTLDSGKKIEIDSNQLEKLIKMPGIFAIKHPPSSASSDLTFIKLPDELGGGFLVGTAKNLIAGFEALETEKRAEKKTPGTFSGEAGIVLRNKDIDGDSSKAEEYRDFSTSVHGDVKIKYEKKDKSFSTFTGKNIGRDDQYYNFTTNYYDKFKIDAGYDEIPHRFSDNAKTLYLGTGSGNLILNGTKQNVPFADRADRLNTLLTNSSEIEIGLKRKKVKMNADLALLDPFNFRVELSSENKTGTRPYFGSFGLDNTIEIPEPIDFDTSDMKFIGEYNLNAFNFSASYYFSRFNNNTDTLTFDNPFRATDAVFEPSKGLIDLAPDNLYHNVSLSGSYLDLPLNSRVSVNAAWGWMRQDDELVPYTTNTAITTGAFDNAPFDAFDPANLPANNVDARVNTSLYHVLLTSKPLDFMHVKGKFRYFDYDNGTEKIQFPGFVDADDFWVDNPIVNLPTSYKKTTTGAEVGFDITKKTRLNLDYTFERTDQKNREVDKLEDHIFGSAIDTKAFSWMNLKLSYKRTERDISNYNYDVYLKAGEDLQQLSGLRKYTQADMSRDRINFIATVYPTDLFMVSTSFIYGKDEFNESPYGLLDDKHHIFSLDIDYSPIDRLNLHTFYNYEYYVARQKDRGEVPSLPVVDADWFARTKDIVNTLGAGIKLSLIPDRLAFDVSYSFSKVDGTIDFFTPAVETSNFDTADDTTLHILQTTFEYRAWKHWLFTLGYCYEKFDYDDFNTQGFTNVPTDSSNNYNGAYLMGTLPGDYTVNVVYLKISYKF
ncbi:MAG: MtrB/PioB family decaheme-associated outer membrane protein [Desulfobacteraceae bacterium]|nr:MtrB/PioB family decaheme-associated outer membrane protein [Desulfobacteraceae bacterium]MDH3837909.1 MtrB/PioB family decaheme-associated outer membrane protein [Desulfobacteraceae bacterium]